MVAAADEAAADEEAAAVDWVEPPTVVVGVAVTPKVVVVVPKVVVVVPKVVVVVGGAVVVVVAWSDIFY